MPELPEVETTRRILAPLLINQPLLSVQHSDPARYQRTEWLQGRKVVNSQRRGKYLIFGLEGNLELIVHLGMTGGFRFEEHPHTRVSLQLPQLWLYFTDPRRFGKWWVVEAGQYQEVGLLQRMGPEPLSAQFSLEGFAQALSSTSRKIKEVLLNQEAVAGVGNIYADESLWHSQVHPSTPANQLPPTKIAALWTAIRQVMNQAVEAGGSTLSDQSYRQPSGEPGYFQFEHQAYDRGGQPCTRCGAPISKIFLGGRGTHFCPRCQI